jgi:hypothetical protein
MSEVKILEHVNLICGHGVWVRLVQDVEHYKLLLKASGARPSFDIDNTAAAAHSYIADTGALCSVVWLDPERPDKSLLYLTKTLGHEATHVWQFFERQYGHITADEVEAMCIEAIYGKLLEQYNSKLCEQSV